MTDQRIDFNNMPPQIRMMYERMLLPKLKEFSIEELGALRNFFNEEVDKLIAEHDDVIESTAVDEEEQRQLLAQALQAQGLVTACGVKPLIPMKDGSGCTLPAGHDGYHSWATVDA